VNECPEEALLLDYADGRLPPPGALEVRKHVEGCESCRDVLSHLPDTGSHRKTARHLGDGDAERTRLVDPLIGATVGEYRIEDRIGEGGMGMVYRGLQPVIGKPVAIKVLRPELVGSESTARRFVDEARAANTIGHRNIIDIFSFGVLPTGEQYFVMEYLVGEPLSHYVRRTGALPVREAVDLLVELVSALSAAHAAGVVHRDLKPSNLFLVHEPDGERLLKVLDFGIAKVLTNDRPNTQPGSILGTPEYMSPEQVRGEPSGPEADLYAVGVIAFELVTGQRPFHGRTAEVMAQHLDAAPPGVSTLTPGVPPALDALVARLLSKRAADRGTTERVLEALTGISKKLPRASANALEKVSPDETTEPVGRPLGQSNPELAVTAPARPFGRRRVAVVAAAAGLVALVALAVGLAWPRPEPARLPLAEARPAPPPERHAVAAEPEPAPPPAEPEPPKKAAPPRPADVKARRADLTSQIESLRRATKADAAAQLLLDDAEKRARAAQTLDDVKKVERVLDAVRAGYVKKR